MKVYDKFSKRRKKLAGLIFIIFLILVLWLEHRNYSAFIELSASEALFYSQYTINMGNIPDQTVTLDSILACCSLQNQIDINESMWMIYDSNSLANYIYHCGEIVEITKMVEGNLYITCITIEGYEIIFTISADGIEQTQIYDGESDTLYVFEESISYKSPHFRYD